MAHPRVAIMDKFSGMQETSHIEEGCALGQLGGGRQAGLLVLIVVEVGCVHAARPVRAQPRQLLCLPSLTAGALSLNHSGRISETRPLASSGTECSLEGVCSVEIW